MLNFYALFSKGGGVPGINRNRERRDYTPFRPGTV
jgi:hypothetical protein